MFIFIFCWIKYVIYISVNNGNGLSLMEFFSLDFVKFKSHLLKFNTHIFVIFPTSNSMVETPLNL